MSKWEIGSLKCPGGSLQIIDSFCYFGDLISSKIIRSPSSEITFAGIKVWWKKFQWVIFVGNKRSRFQSGKQKCMMLAYEKQCCMIWDVIGIGFFKKEYSVHSA